LPGLPGRPSARTATRPLPRELRRPQDLRLHLPHGAAPHSCRDECTRVGHSFPAPATAAEPVKPRRFLLGEADHEAGASPSTVRSTTVRHELKAAKARAGARSVPASAVQIREATEDLGLVIDLTFP
jgi:hypothetical protein